MRTSDYQSRRKALAMQLPSQSIAIIPAANDVLRNGDAHYRFRQDSDFFYLTGFNEPDAVLLITSGSESVSVLFNRAKNPEQEQWTGRRLGQEEAIHALGLDEAYPIELLEQKLPGWIENRQAIYYCIGRHSLWDARIQQAWQVVKGQIRRGIKAPGSFSDLAPLLGEMRLFKQPSEIALMQRAGDITVTAHQRAMQVCKASQYEYELEAEIIHEFTRQGCRSTAYDSIVAAGKNACILHYTENNSRLQPGDLVLIDAGAEYENYAADVTRTFPVNGHFSAEQRVIYNLVLQAQQAGIKGVYPGASWDSVQTTIVRILTEGLVDLGILRGQTDELIAAGAHRPFYMHNSGHWLGLDVHDSGQYKINGQWRLLEPNMVLTVEPGLYISRHPDVDERWWDIGVRIEDDILVTQNGHSNLTGDLAVKVEEIEALMRD